MDATSTGEPSSVAATERYRFHRELLVELMEERGLSDAALALKAGLDRSTVHRMRTGRQVPSLPAAGAIADALLISVDRLIVRDPD